MDGHSLSALILRIAVRRAPKRHAAGAEFGQECVGPAAVRESRIAEIDWAVSEASQKNCILWTQRNRCAGLIVIGAESLRPEASSRRVELCKENIERAGAGENGAASSPQIEYSVEVARNDELAGACDLQAVRSMFSIVAIGIAPLVRAGIAELGDEHVRPALRGRKIAAAKIHFAALVRARQ